MGWKITVTVHVWEAFNMCHVQGTAWTCEGEETTDTGLSNV